LTATAADLQVFAQGELAVESITNNIVAYTKTFTENVIERYLKIETERQIELKCADFEMLMENKGFDEAEIEKKVNEYRKLLLSQVASGELDIEAEMDAKDSHARAK
uniref:CWF21 domain-containing protein n=1 Tax=Parascaris equorum TaxID=6256 RepID=A0A914R1Z9_PAREQ